MEAVRTGISEAVQLRPNGLSFRRALRACVATALLLLLAAPVRAATADISITALAPPTARVGDDFGSTLIVSNDGPEAAAEVRVTDPLATGVVLYPLTTDRGSCEVGTTISCQVGPLAPGERATISIRAVTTRPAMLTLTASVTSADDATSDDNTVRRTIRSWGPACTVIGTAGTDVLVPTGGLDVLCGLGGTDTIDAGRGDRAFGGDGDDILRTTDVNVLLDGGRGNDRLDGSAGSDLLRAGTGDDTVTGGAGDDHIDGGLGTDVLSAGDGVDACTEAGSSCYLTSPTDVRETGALVDIRSVRTTFGTSMTFVIESWRPWSLRDAEERGWFQVRLDTAGSSAVDYVAIVRVHRGVLRGSLLRLANTPDRQITSLIVRRLSSTRVSVVVRLSNMRRDGARMMYRWGVSSLWLTTSCSRTVCLDGVPSVDHLLPQPFP